MNLNVWSIQSSQNIFHDLKGPKVKYNLHYRWVHFVPYGNLVPLACEEVQTYTLNLCRKQK